MVDQIRRTNFDQICRLCLEYASDTNTLFPIFINEANIPGFYGRFLKEFKESIPEVILTCIGIEIDPSVQLPLHICSNCESQLITSHQFRQKCLQSNDYLLELRMAGEDDDSDADDDTPLDSLNQPELILVDDIKEENDDEDIKMDSSCDSVWQNKLDDKSSCNENVSIKIDSQRVIKKTATKRSKTFVPLITPSTPIVPVDSNKSSTLPKRTVKYVYAKKPKMCTVCGVIVDRLRDHMRTHPEGLEYSCSHCSLRYLSKQGLSKHIRHQHTEDSSIENKINGGQGQDTDSCNKNLWQCNLRKRFRQMGETYIAVDGSVKSGRTVKNSCPASCYLKCHLKVDAAQRLEIHKSFWKLTDNEKDHFYANHVQRIHSVRKRTKAEQSQRLYSFTYFFDICDADGASSRAQVCQKFFVSTLDVSKGRIYYYFQNIHDSVTGTPIVGSDQSSSNYNYNKRGERIGRKPLAEPHTWKRNVAKMKRNFGQSYITAKGIERPEKKLQQPCSDTCRMKCTAKITHAQREEIFKHFWSISDLTQKRVFLIRHIEHIVPKYRRSNGLRSLNYAYFFDIDDRRIQVCKTFYTKTLDVSHVFIKTAIKKFNSEKGCLEGERRGKCKNV